VVGPLTLRKSRGRREPPLALMPMLFGAQQLTEGVVCVTVGHDFPAFQ
jgi:hypothetical protein